MSTQSVPDQTRPETEKIFSAPQDELQSHLAQIWEQILGIHPIGVRDNFFALGGHSLLAARLLTQIEQTFGKNISLTTLFQAPTVEQLAEVIRREGWSAPYASLTAIQPGGERPPLFFVLLTGPPACR